ncbi:galactose oxidase [Linderina pennispora]|uniref:Galactose oxidase n=1 Tax=Linderina pennispora TaxID=61395 RepID=A0A1Y1WBV2_9FUNG|nr:galactose oxidase [Linderina pennispora]ORX70634.1 galactose oxidase [Linderina pennispora]
MPSTELDASELFIRGHKCTGDVPPALVGSSLTYLDGKAYVFGGRSLHTGQLSSDLFVCDLGTFAWRRLAGTSGTSPAARFFHSATAFRQFIIVFGGMGLVAGSESMERSVDESNRSNKLLLGDMAVFDTQTERWVAERALDSGGPAGPAVEAEAPAPRYAHLATLLGSRLLVVGGQDLDEQYVEELNVYDLQRGAWVLRAGFPRAVGLYRSFIAGTGDGGRTLLYSNYSFAAVKRALYALSAPPDCTLQDLSEAIQGEPPGLRFPRGSMVDGRTVLMTGTLISHEGHSELSVWALDVAELQWRVVDCGGRFRAGSWNQSLVDPRSNTLVLFGDSRRDLTYDYQRRRLNYGEVRTVDLRALGFRLSRGSTKQPFATAARAAAVAAASDTASPPPRAADALFELGAQLLFVPQLADAHIDGSDGHVPVNSGLLQARWPVQAQQWAGIADDLLTADMPRRFQIDASCAAIHILVFFLHTGRVDVAARHGPHAPSDASAATDAQAVAVLGELLGVARASGLRDLGIHAVNALRDLASPQTAPLVFEAGLRAQHRGLQARSVVVLRGHLPALAADRGSALYAISEPARLALLKYFPRAEHEAEPETRARAPSDAGSTPLLRKPPRSPFQQAGMFEMRRPWDTSVMNSPVITSPLTSSPRFAGSPDAEKRTSGNSPLINQVDVDDSSQYSSASSNRLSVVGGSTHSNASDGLSERRPSDAPEPSSSRASIFRPWSKVKKIANAAAGNSAPAVPSMPTL